MSLIPTHKPLTFKQSLSRSARVPVGLFCGFAVAFAILQIFNFPLNAILAPHDAAPTPMSPVERLMTEHAGECWTGAAPAGVKPHHVIVTAMIGPIGKPATLQTVYGGQSMTWLALDVLFGDPDTSYTVDGPFTVHAFCR